MSVSVDDLRKKLTELGMSKEEVASIKGKANLLAKIRELSNENPFDALVDEDNNENVNSSDKPRKSNVPRLGSKDWQDYVLSLLEKDEYADVNGERFPKASGLRRVAQLVLGDIVSCGPTIVFPAADDKSAGRATVVFEVKIAWKENVVEGWYDLNEFKDFEIRTFSDVAESWHGNTPDKFAVHAAATASSRAMGRAFKNALCINVLTAEEMSNDKDPSQFASPKTGDTGDYNEDDKINGSQKEMITDKCAMLGIDVYKFINLAHYAYNEGPIKYVSIETVPRGVAAKMIKQLNIYQSCTDKSIEPPKEILVDSHKF